MEADMCNICGKYNDLIQKLQDFEEDVAIVDEDCRHTMLGEKRY